MQRRISRTALASADVRHDGDPLRPGHPVHLMGVHQRAVDSGLLPSMGSKGDCYDCEDRGALSRSV